jgi:hypothetical protein
VAIVLFKNYMDKSSNRSLQQKVIFQNKNNSVEIKKTEEASFKNRKSNKNTSRIPPKIVTQNIPQLLNPHS